MAKQKQTKSNSRVADLTNAKAVTLTEFRKEYTNAEKIRYYENKILDLELEILRARRRLISLYGR